MTFDRLLRDIDARKAGAGRVKLEPPKDGDPCAHPRCVGHYRATLDCSFRRVLRCDGCRAEVPRDGPAEARRTGAGS